MTFSDERLRYTGSRFRIAGEFAGVTHITTGHINDTFLVTYRQTGGNRRYIHQRINREVFPDPVALMTNLQKILRHLRGNRSDSDAIAPIHLLDSDHGEPWITDDDGYLWRTYEYIDGVTRQAPANSREAQSAGSAFGQFQLALADMDPSELTITIPGFHDTAKRFSSFELALASAPDDRIATAAAQIDFIVSRQWMTTVFPALERTGNLPTRIAHNDAKFGNVILNADTGLPRAIIDMDTVMPGSVLYDFGDLVRSSAYAGAEDECDLANVAVDRGMFKSLASGYLSVASEFLTDCEREHLVAGAKLMTFEVGMRFLTDYLSGDVYFHQHRPGQNLDRCKTQFRLVESMETNEHELESILQRLLISS
jgi:Ser/Thr protein kinase RdoA (MazF antagonist)